MNLKINHIILCIFVKLYVLYIQIRNILAKIIYCDSSLNNQFKHNNVHDMKNQQNEYVPSKDLDQPVDPPSLFGGLGVHSMGTFVFKLSSCVQ